MTRLSTLLLCLVLVAPMLLAQGQGQGQGQPDTPTLSEVDRLRVQNVIQAIEIAQLKAQVAQRDFDAAKQGLVSLAQQLRREGFELDLQTLTYRPLPKPASATSEK